MPYIRRMDALFRAIAEPNRRRILELVRDRELSAGEIAARFSVSRPAVSQHLKVLSDSGLLERRKVGARRLYRVRGGAIAELKAFVDAQWEGSLERLKAEAEARPGGFLVEPAKIVSWMGVGAVFDARPGGMVRIDVTPGNTVGGEVIEIVKPGRVVYSWGWEGGETVPPGSSRVEITLTPERGGTRLRLVHSGLAPSAAERHERGWTHYVERLRTAAAGGDPGPDPWSARSGR